MAFVRGIILMSILTCTSGCRSVGSMLIDMIDGDSFQEEAAREAREKPWRDYWRDNPTVNPKMTEAFRDE